MIVNMIVNIVVMIVDMIVNMDETPMWFGKTTRKTVHSKGARLCTSGLLVLKSED